MVTKSRFTLNCSAAELTTTRQKARDSKADQSSNRTSLTLKKETYILYTCYITAWSRRERPEDPFKNKAWSLSKKAQARPLSSKKKPKYLALYPQSSKIYSPSPFTSLLSSFLLLTHLLSSTLLAKPHIAAIAPNSSPIYRLAL